MTKEELDRIKTAYYSGLKVQIWFNGYWEDFDAREYSMYPDPFSKNRQYRIVGSDYAEKAEKRIAELEEQEREHLNQIENLTMEIKELKDYAKSIIKDLLDNSDEYCRQRAYDFLGEENV